MRDIYVGSIFHKWTVIDSTLIPTNNNYSKKVLCKCQCGTERLVEVRSLRSGHSKSCGCRKQDNANARFQKKVGKRYGYLTIIGMGIKDKNYRLECQCDCGNIIRASFHELEKSRVVSCGCKKQSEKRIAMEQLIGERFFKILVLGIENFEESTVRYRCDCGVEKTARYYHIKYGRISSCGCLKSKGEFVVGQILQKLDIPFKKEVSFPDCKSEKPLPFDFGIYSKTGVLLGLIEYNGNIHYSSKGTGWNTPDRLLKTQKHDYIKQLYCETRGIPLLVIPFTVSDIEEFFTTSDFYQIISRSFND